MAKKKKKKKKKGTAFSSTELLFPLNFRYTNDTNMKSNPRKIASLLYLTTLKPISYYKKYNNKYSHAAPL